MLGGGSLGAAATLNAVFTESFCNQNPSWVVQVAGDSGYESGTAALALSAPEEARRGGGLLSLPLLVAPQAEVSAGIR